MTLYEREKLIAECRKKLPYPISFYDKLTDGSLWNVYNKHVVNGIPIDKKGRKAKIENDKARAQEQSGKQLTFPGFEEDDKPSKEDKDLDEELALAVLEYLKLLITTPKPKVFKDDDGIWWRLNDGGTYDWIPDSELQDALESYDPKTRRREK